MRLFLESTERPSTTTEEDDYGNRPTPSCIDIDTDAVIVDADTDLGINN